MENDLQWKTAFNSQTTFVGRQPFIEEHFQLNTTFDRRKPLMDGQHYMEVLSMGESLL